MKSKGLRFLFIVVFIVLSLYVFISNAWRISYKLEAMKAVAIEINNTEPLPELFYQTYDKIYPNARKISKNQELLYAMQSIWNPTISKRSYFTTIAFEYYFFKEAKNDISSSLLDRFLCNYYIFSWGLEEFTTVEKCFDAYWRKIIYDIRNVSECTRELTSIPLKELSQEQIVKILVIERGYFTYDECKNKENFDKRFNLLMGRLNE